MWSAWPPAIRSGPAHYADKHAIGRVMPTYAALVEDPDVDAIYNPLPNGLHGRWTLAAMAAGKHVLCEKPFTANAKEAAHVAGAGDAAGVMVMEAFHYRHHPLAARMREVVEQGLIGEVRHIEAWMCFPLPFRKDIRYRLDLAGGATMDAGCYALNMIRFMAAAEPEVVSARAKLSSPGVDRAMVADLSFADGRTARMHTSMLSSSVLRIAVRVTGDRGRAACAQSDGPPALSPLGRAEPGRKAGRAPGRALHLPAISSSTSPRPCSTAAR